jgi:hypothetical protein
VSISPLAQTQAADPAEFFGSFCVGSPATPAGLLVILLIRKLMQFTRCGLSSLLPLLAHS